MIELYDKWIEKYKSNFCSPQNGGKITDFLMYRALERDKKLEIEKENSIEL